MNSPQERGQNSHRRDNINTLNSNAAAAVMPEVTMTTQHTSAVWELIVEEAWQAHANGEFIAAQTTYALAVGMAERCPQVDLKSLRHLLLRLADLYTEQHELALAEATFLRALSSCESDTTSTDIAVIAKELSETCRAQGKFIDARNYMDLAARASACARTSLKSNLQCKFPQPNGLTKSTPAAHGITLRSRHYVKAVLIAGILVLLCI